MQQLHLREKKDVYKFFIVGPKRKKSKYSKTKWSAGHLYFLRIIYFVFTCMYVFSLLLSSENIQLFTFFFFFMDMTQRHMSEFESNCVSDSYVICKNKINNYLRIYISLSGPMNLIFFSYNILEN